ncbi:MULTISPECIES: FUSC family protein [Cobetia]|uniref:FUSC family protein n=1 Tax=Cobetia TaxID=204286 RepID=UPI00158257F2|nr:MULTISPECIES: FUSC family protein [Cobetia]MDI4661070.1 FUSC family protein [Cobetia sp. BMC6]NUJ55611.1 FUSC family protein [Cobetia marina]UBU47257.1 FUSC family protein [Cobetia amphilecti]
MSPALAAFLRPSPFALKFATKGVLAMALALYAAFFFDLDRPYWALISAAFLQTRPMSGMVVEKGICQVTGTFVGTCVAVVIMGCFAQVPELALGSVTLWIGLCIYGASLTHNNLSYGCVMAAVACMIIVVLTSSAPDDFFSVALARLSELSLGALCAVVVSALLWPIRVRDHLGQLADTAVNATFRYMALAFSMPLEGGKTTGRQKDQHQERMAMLEQMMTGLEALNNLEIDAHSARYEGPQGKGRIRGVHLLTRRSMRLYATLKALHQLRHPEFFVPSQNDDGGASAQPNELNQVKREEAERFSQPTQDLMQRLGAALQSMADNQGTAQARKTLKELRGECLRLSRGQRSITALEARLLFSLREVLGHALVILQAREVINHPDRHQLRQPSMSWHRDHGRAAIDAIRAMTIFSATAIFWLATAWDNGAVAMLLGTLFSGIFVSRGDPAPIIPMVLKGLLLAVPSVLLFGNVMLSHAHHFVPFVTIFSIPLFLGLMGSVVPALAGIALPFVVFNILLVMPDNGMTFDVAYTLNRSLAAGIGLIVTIIGFRLIPVPGAGWDKRQLIRATASDIRELAERSTERLDSWFGGRMGDRLLRLARHEQTRSREQEARRSGETANGQPDAAQEQVLGMPLLTLGLTGMDIGRGIGFVRRELGNDVPRPVQHALRELIHGLADDYQRCARGESPTRMRAAGDRLCEVIEQHRTMSRHKQALLAGWLTRVQLTLQSDALLQRQQ